MIRPVLLAILAALLGDAARAAPALTPGPVLEAPRDGIFRLTRATVILTPPGDVGARRTADYLAAMLARSPGLKLSVREGTAAPGENAIRLTRGGPKGEAYVLDAGPDGLTIASEGDAGLFYGAVTAWQLATPVGAAGSVDIAAVHIEDAPRFAWRGLMIDSARHMQSPATLRAMIDAMAVHKLNVLHWHLTDDQGWRLEIKKYPRLTEVGGWRTPAGAAGRDPVTGKAVRYGGYYTQDQVREIVAYAQARHVTIVPEIETPGHALAAILAYPDLGVRPAPPQIAGDWGVFPYLYNTDDATFTVLEGVLDEVMDLFPGTYIHVGGDEAVKDQWKADAATQAKIKALGLSDEHALQSWFIQRLGRHIAAHGRRLIGWDEILEGGLAPDATVMSWRGIDGAVAAAKLGHDTVLSPWPLLYLDNRQSASADEPPGRGRVVSLKDVYDFDPAPAALTPEERAHVLGVQANGWTEHMRTDTRLEQMTFPRLTALAEVGWSPERARNWSDFATRLPASLARLDLLGVAYDSVPFEPQAQLAAGAATAQVTLASGLGLGEIRYTTDGRKPGPASPIYAGPLTLTTPATVRSRTYLAGRPLGRERRLPVDAAALTTRNSHQLKACTDKLTLSLEDDAPSKGARAVFLVDLMNPCWIWTAADLTDGAALTTWVGQTPFNFQIGADRDKIPLRPPATPAGELEVRLDTCEGPVVAILPLAPAVANSAVTKLSGHIAPKAGQHDLCFTFTARSVDPTWVIDRIALTAVAADK